MESFETRWEQLQFGFEKNMSNNNIIFYYKESIYLFKPLLQPHTYSELVIHNLYTKQTLHHKLKGEDLPKVRIGFRGEVIDDSFYLFGGKFSDEIFVSQIYQFDIPKLEWITLHDSSIENKIEHTLTTFGNYLVLFGGYNASKLYNDIKLFDLANAKWINLQVTAAFPKHRYGHSAAIYKDKLFIYGGRDKMDILNDLWCFDFESSFWTRVNYVGLIKPCFRMSSLIGRDSMLIFGGAESSQHYSSSLYEFQFESLAFTALKTPKSFPKLSERCLSNFIRTNDQIIILGGFDGSYIEDVWSLQLEPKKMASFVQGYSNQLYQGAQQSNQQLVLKFHQQMQNNSLKSVKNESSYPIDGSYRGSPNISESDSVINLDNYVEWCSIDYKGDVFTPRTGHSVCTYQDSIYIFGGSDSQKLLNDFYRFNIFDQSMKEIKPTGDKISVRSGTQAAVCNGSIYIFGGYTQRNGEYFNDLFQYESKQNKWLKITLQGCEAPRRTDHSLNAFKKYLLIFGGIDGKDKFNELYRIDTEHKTIKQMEEFGEVPVPRFGHTSVIYKNSMYVFGGWNGYETLDDLYQYSFISNFWYLEKVNYGCKPPSRYRHSATVIGGSMFVFGGINTQAIKFNDLYEYNFGRREWRLIEAYGQTPIARTFHKITAHSNQIFLVGGSFEEKLNDVHSITIYHINDISDSQIDHTEHSYTYSDAEMFNDEKKSISDSLDKGDSSNVEQVIQLLKRQVQEISKKLKEEQERNLCVICCQEAINSVFLKCGHKAACYYCAVKFNECPVCREPIERLIRIYPY